MSTFRRFLCLEFVLLICALQLRVMAQSYPRAHAYFAPHPDYPYSARVKHLQGSGIFIVQIDPKKGLVTSVSVKKSTGWDVLDKSAIETLRRWKFTTPTKPSVEVPIEFGMVPGTPGSHPLYPTRSE